MTIMSLLTKWSFYLFMALAAIARGQTAEPKDQGKSAALILSGQGNMYQPNQLTGKGAGNLFYFDYPSQSPDQQSGLFAYHEVGDHSTGMSLAAVDDAVREHLKLPKGQGLIVTSIVPQGMAMRAGIFGNDILLTLGDAPLGKAEDLEEHLKAAGDKPLDLVLLHQGEKKTVQVQPRINVTFGPVQPEPPAFWIGVSVSPVEPALQAHLRLLTQGLLATEVIANGPAAKAGLKVNDILLTMAGKPLWNQATLIDLVQKNVGKAVAVEFLREGLRQTVELTPERRGPSSMGAVGDPRLSKNLSYSRHPSRLRCERRAKLVDDTRPTQRTANGSKHSTRGLKRLQRLNHRSPMEPLSKRLDGMSAEIKELRKAIDELSKVLKDRK